jgi:hypothetical protein
MEVEPIRSSEEAVGSIGPAIAIIAFLLQCGCGETLILRVVVQTSRIITKEARLRE